VLLNFIQNDILKSIYTRRYKEEKKLQPVQWLLSKEEKKVRKERSRQFFPQMSNEKHAQQSH
jgi:hypothetical protein